MAAALTAGCGTSIEGTSDNTTAIDAAIADDGSLETQDAGGTTAVRFIVMGDTGTGSDTQHAIGAAVAQQCAAKGCDFVLMLGDNMYNNGVESVTDPQWVEKFEDPYKEVDPSIPFHVVLGNHDYGGKILGQEQAGIGNEFDKGPIEVQYSDYSDRWNMPATFYTLRVGNVGFMMLDTNSLLWDDTTNGDQAAWYAEGLAELEGADWILGAGHHPYLSNGTHGNAGSYESIEMGGVDVSIPLPILDGKHIKEFFDSYVCGTVSVYFSGHDHNRQWIDEPEALCGATMIVSGAGAKVKELPGNGNTTLFEDATQAGFAYVVVDGDDFRLQFMDAERNVEFEQSISKP